MLYGVLFESPAQREKLLDLLKAARIRAHSVEVVEPSIVQEYNRHMEQMKDVIEPVRKHRRDLERAERAFRQDPSPRLATAIKQLKAAIRREERKQA
jgi:hypothetical protein